MKSWILGAIVMACGSFGAVAVACPVGVEGTRPKPVVQNVSFQASELLERASRLESAASTQEQSARALEQEADTLSSRARILRGQAALVNAADRFSILEIADELASRAASERARAGSARAQASELRASARNLRERAVTLVRNGGGGGWRRRPIEGVGGVVL